MTGRLDRAPRLVAALMGVLMGCSLAACGDSEEKSSPGASSTPTAAASSTPSDGYPFDTSDVGDDLLAPKRTSFSFGKDAPTSWRFPAFYLDGETDETSGSVEVDGVLYGIQAVAGTGTTPRAQAEDIAKKLKAADDAVQEVTLDGREWVAVVNEGPALSRIVLYGAFPGGVVAGAGFTADVPLKDVPPERIDELHQMVQSIEVEAGSSR